MFVRSKLDRRFAQFCRTGDPDALAFVFDQTAGRLLRVALWLSRQRADAEDLLQRTFVQAIALRARFEPGRRVMPWLMGLMANQAHLLRRERQRREDAAPRVDRVVDPEAEAVAHELQDAVRAVRANLSEPYRDVLELHLEQGLDAGEIAQRLGRPAGTVRTQLMRALEMLRKKLPSGFVAGFAPVAMPGAGSLGAVRAAVVDAARRGAATAATTMAGAVVVGIGGVLVAKKLLVVVPVCALLLGVAVQQVWSRWSPAEMAAPGVPAVAAAVDSQPPATTPSSATPIERRDVTPGGDIAAALTPPFDPSPVHVPPWDARMLVVDEGDKPIADATITIWLAKKLPADPRDPINGNRDYRYIGHTGEPVYILHTDVDGRAAVRLDVEGLVAVAGKDGFGHTIETWLNSDRAAAREPKFVLQVPVALHGVVLRADGLPASGARVSASGSTLAMIDGRDPPAPEPVTAHAAGRFELLVHDLSRYTLHAELNGNHTFAEHVKIRDRRGPEVVLAFPGAITIEGLVVDAEGRPVANASVVAWREFQVEGPRPDRDEAECVDGDADVYGRFSLAVMRYARYQLIADRVGNANSAPTWTETTAERPHATVRLELQQFSSIRGRVVHGDGRTFGGVRVGAMPETGQRWPGRNSMMPDQESLFGKSPATTSGEDGAFALPVHPGTTWTIRASIGPAGHRLDFDEVAVAPGRSDVLIRIRDEDVAGCMVHGTVVRADGEPVGHYRVNLVDATAESSRPDGMPLIGRDVAAQSDDAHFTVGPLARGQQFCLRVLPQDGAGYLSPNTGPMAPLQVGPFTTDQPKVELMFRLEGWGELPVRVLTADGLPAKGVLVAAASTTVFEAQARQVVDADGLAVLRRCAPGASRLVGAFEQPLRRGEMPVWLFDQTLVIRPGKNPEVVVHLPTPRPDSKGH